MSACCRRAGCASRSTAARFADAALVATGTRRAAAHVGRALGHQTVVPRHARVRCAAAHGGRSDDTVVVPVGNACSRCRHRAARTLLRRDSCRSAGDVGTRVTFRDHHRFTPRTSTRFDARRVTRMPRDRLTTEKDAVRCGLDAAVLPMPARRRWSSNRAADGFRDWLRERRRRMDGDRARVRGGTAPVDDLSCRCCRMRAAPARCGAALGTCSGSRSTRSIARTGASREQISRPRFPSRPATRAPRARARDVRALRQPAARAPEVQHAIAGPDARARRGRRRGARAPGVRAAARACCSSPGTSATGKSRRSSHALHDQPIGVLARPLDNRAAQRAARANPHAHRQLGDLSPGRGRA